MYTASCVIAAWKTGSKRAPPDGTGIQSLAVVHRVTSCVPTHWNLRTLHVCVCHELKPVYVPPMRTMKTSSPSDSGVW